MSRLIRKIAAKGPLQLFRKTCESYAREGFGTTLARIGHFVKGGSDGASFHRPENLGYVGNRDAQDRYVRAYAKVPSKVRRRALEGLLANERGYRGIVIYPAAYDLSLRQRPEHVLRVLADQGYVCIIVTVGGDEPVIRKRGQRLYECNLYEDAHTHFASLPTVLYITAPMHRYVADLLPRAFVVYDVVDRLEIFANFCDAMVADHVALLERADLVMCTSKALFERTSAMATNVHLVPNGVFPDDFSPVGQPQSITPLVIGYHGVISELLDFDLLDRLAELPGVELLFAGSVNAFITSNALTLKARAEALFSRPNVTHLGVLGYDELRSYLSRIHCGLVPFILDPSTDAVSPLKFFEFVAAGKPVLTTPTKTMREYADFALVADADAIVAAVEQGTWNRMVPSRYAALTQQHAWQVLVAPLTTALQEQDLAHAAFPVHGDQTRVDIVNFNFFDWHGNSVYKGGAERYALDLAHLCKRMGLQVRIVQNAHIHFERNFHGIDVVGVPIVDKLDFRAMSRGFVDVSRDAGLVIASPLDLASDLNPDKRVIGINHGIHWDGRGNRLGNFSMTDRYAIFDALRICDTCVCVDTNFINWVRTIDWPLARHLEYIPNYVDGEHFAPVSKNFDAQKMVALYPRRLYEPRGLYETIEAFDFLLPRHPHLNLHLCGQASAEDGERTRQFMSRHPGRVLWYELEMEEMGQAYAQSHIVLIPTAYAEGTSLSCIEAMATNNCVIATNVGGLPNLITDGYSGLLVKPVARELARAIQTVLDDRPQLARLARNALDVSGVFSKSRWQGRWETTIRDVMNFPPMVDDRIEQHLRAVHSA